MKYRLIAADMDGTLLNEEAELTTRTKTALIKAVEAGILFVTATGRPMVAAEKVNAIFEKDMPFITFNGAVIIMGKSRKTLMNKHLDFALAKEGYTIGASQNIPVIIWTGEQLWVSRECKEVSDYQEASSAKLSVIDEIDDLSERSVSKMLWIGSPEKISCLQNEMKTHFEGKLNCFTSLPIFLEFVSIEADKGTALAEIGRIYGIDRSEMIAVGDGYNDISMIKYAGLGVAMANAPKDVKAASGFVTLSNNDDGVAAVIEKYIIRNS